MRRVLKLLLFSLVGGCILQLLLFGLAALIDPIFGLLVILPGWAVGFAGRDSDHNWSGYLIGWILMLSVNNLIYATIVYILLWRRARTKELEAIRKLDFDAYMERLLDGSIRIR